MKKGLFLLLGVILSVVILQGCQSNPSGKKPKSDGATSGYPVGHDMNPYTEPDGDNFDNGGFS